MPRSKIPNRPRYGTCRVCSQPCTDEGHGFYHNNLDLGTVRGIPPHFASPMPGTAVA